MDVGNSARSVASISVWRQPYKVEYGNHLFLDHLLASITQTATKNILLDFLFPYFLCIYSVFAQGIEHLDYTLYIH